MTITALLLLLTVQAQAPKPAKPAPKPAARTAARPAPAAKPAAAPALPASPWTLRENADAAAGVRYASVSITGADNYRFSVRCDLSADPVISVQFIPPKAFGTQAEKLVTVLPDNAGAIVVPWEFVGTGAINRSTEVYNIVKLVAAAKRFRVFSTNAAGDPVSDGFEAPGSDAPFRHVFEFCGTPYGPMSATPPPPPPPVTPEARIQPGIKLVPSSGFNLSKVPPAPAPTPAPTPSPQP